MTLPLKNNKTIKLIFILVPALLATACLVGVVRQSAWTAWDWQILDAYFRRAVRSGHGAELSPDILYAMITDDSYEDSDHKILNRSVMADVNQTLATHGATAVAYDIIFSRPSHPADDRRFAQSLAQLDSVFLPIALDYTSRQRTFKWEVGAAYDRLRTDYVKVPQQSGRAQPLYASRAVTQIDDFVQAVPYTGHISAASDADGVYRHIPVLIKVDSGYVPTLALAMFLQHTGIPLQVVRVHWGHAITIPATPSNGLDADIVIPINEQGYAFIPYPQVWNQDFDKIALHKLLKYRKDPTLQGNLTDLIEGRFVFIGDASVGTSDIGLTPLEDNMPLVAIHAAFLNGLLTNTFYQPWTFWRTQGLLIVLSVLLGLAALPRAAWILYAVGALMLVGIWLLTWQQFITFHLTPIFTLTISFLWIFFGLVIGLQLAIAQERTFVRNAFAKYVPEKVVNELLAHPERLHLGGKVQTLSILFSDIEGFTQISETMEPDELGQLLNEYLSAMTDIVLAQNGIIDKYEGDAIMAEFGAPLPLDHHADRAVQTGLSMQHRLRVLRRTWKRENRPALKCRVGINTGQVVLGNMGSQQIFDYTVLGDAVNLASRLESANKNYQTQVMISEFTHACLTPNQFRTRLLDVIKVQGKTKAVKVFEVYGAASDLIKPNDLSYYQTYEQSFNAYLARQFTTALDGFRKALALRPGDLASKTLIERIQELDPHNLPPDWDGAVELTSK